MNRSIDDLNRLRVSLPFQLSDRCESLWHFYQNRPAKNQGFHHDRRWANRFTNRHYSDYRIFAHPSIHNQHSALSFHSISQWNNWIPKKWFIAFEGLLLLWRVPTRHNANHRPDKGSDEGALSNCIWTTLWCDSTENGRSTIGCSHAKSISNHGVTACCRSVHWNLLQIKQMFTLLLIPQRLSYSWNRD